MEILPVVIGVTCVALFRVSSIPRCQCLFSGLISRQGPGLRFWGQETWDKSTDSSLVTPSEVNPSLTLDQYPSLRLGVVFGEVSWYPPGGPFRHVVTLRYIRGFAVVVVVDLRPIFSVNTWGESGWLSRREDSDSRSRGRRDYGRFETLGDDLCRSVTLVTVLCCDRLVSNSFNLYLFVRRRRFLSLKGHLTLWLGSFEVKSKTRC